MAEGLHDIHNPPKVPYKHQDFPMLVYRKPKAEQHPNQAHKLVNDKAELDAALKAGYQAKPYSEPVEEAIEESPAPRRGRKSE